MCNWFGKKKEEKKQVLTANEAYEASILRNEQIKEERRKGVIDLIHAYIKNGQLSVECNRHNRYSGNYLDMRDIPYLESLGYKVEKKQERLSTICVNGQGNDMMSTYYIISWDLNKD